MSSQRAALSKKRVTHELSTALNQAAALMRLKKQQLMSAEILLQAFVTTPETEAYQLLRMISQEQPFNWSSLEQDIDRATGNKTGGTDVKFDFITDDQQRVALGREVLIVLDEGLSLAEAQSQGRCSTVQALTVMADIKISTHWLLNRYRITQRVIVDMAASRPEVSALPSGNAPTSAGPGTIFHRVELEHQLINLLSMKNNRNIILVGPPGVGKRSLVLALKALIAQGQGPYGIRQVVELDEKRLLDDAEGTVQEGVRQARGGILFVPDIARFFGGLRADLGEAAGTALQKAFLTENLVVIGTTNEEVLNQKLRNTRAISSHSQILRVPPAKPEETEEILKVLRPAFEQDYELTIVDASLAEATRLAGRYYTVKPLPGAAVELLHRACALVKTNRGVAKNDQQLDPDDVMIATSMLTGIPISNMGADERNRYINMVAHLQERIIGQETAVMALSRAVKMARVGLKDPKRPIGSFLFLGPTGVGKSELAKALAEFLFGTERALITLDMSEYMDASSVNRLIGSPPGYVGHEAGGQLTDAVKKQPYSVVLFDEVEKANRQVFDVLLQVMDEGRLTSGQGETVNFSECVILMTSNIGGEHLADARMSDSFATDGAADLNEPAYNEANIRRLLHDGFSDEELLTIYSADALITLDDVADAGDKEAIITTLIAQARSKSQLDLLLSIAERYNANKYNEHQPYYNWAVARQRAEEKLKGHFRPEFLNRLDDIIYFHPLTEDHLRTILGLLLRREESLLDNQSLRLEVTDAAKNWILAQNEHPEWGARPLRRLLQRNIREPLAELLLKETPTPGTTMKVQKKGNNLVFVPAAPSRQ